MNDVWTPSLQQAAVSASAMLLIAIGIIAMLQRGQWLITLLFSAAFLSLGGKDLVRMTGVDPLKLPAGKQTLTLRIPALGLTRELELETGGRAPKKYHVELVD